MVSAFAREDALRAATGLPLAAVLQKPVTPGGLQEALLRAGRDSPPAPQPMPLGLHISDSTRARLAGARILLAEDHPLNQELACELLRRAGMDVVVAQNGEEALQKLANEGPFDGVLMDCQMPVMDGYTATQHIRARETRQRLPRTPIVALTANAYEEDAAHALAVGMDAHLAKPYTRDQLREVISTWL